MEKTLPCEQHAREIGSLQQAIESGRDRFDRMEEKIDQVFNILSGNGTKGYVARSIQNEEEVVRLRAEVIRLKDELKEEWRVFKEELGYLTKTMQEIAPMVRFSRRYVFLLAGFFGLLGGAAAEYGTVLVSMIGALI